MEIQNKIDSSLKDDKYLTKHSEFSFVHFNDVYNILPK